MKKPKRSIREAFEAASAVFNDEGFATRLDYGTGKGHAMCVATRLDVTLRLPLPGSPASGSQQGARLAAASAKRRLRQFHHRIDATHTPEIET